VRLQDKKGRYSQGEQWWLDEETDAARGEDAARYGHNDPWTGPIAAWMTGHMHGVTVADVLNGALEMFLASGDGVTIPACLRPKLTRHNLLSSKN